MLMMKNGDSVIELLDPCDFFDFSAPSCHLPKFGALSHCHGDHQLDKK